MAQKTHNPEEEDNDVEYILKDLGGTFGKFQILNHILLFIAMCVSGMFILDYVFTTLDVDYRCKVPDCDASDAADFNPGWLPYAVPYKNGHPSKCYRYATVAETGTSSGINGTCDASFFNRSQLVKCSDDSFIYRTDEISIVNQFNVTCDENSWKLVLIGSMNNVGRLVFMPLVGYFSDRFGRKNILISCVLLASIFKFIRSFSINYTMFVVFEFLDASFASAIYPAALILAMEWASTKRRVMVICLIVLSYPFGQVITAMIASYTHDFRLLLQALSVPSFLIISYYWLAPESLRWLLVNKRYNQTMETVERAARMNNIKLSQRTFDIIADKCKQDTENSDSKNESESESLKVVFTSKLLLVRFIICTFCWVTCTFVTYGVSIASVSLQGDKYVNYIVVSLGAVPGVFLTFLMLSTLGRRWAICASLFVTGASILASKYLSSYGVVSLIFFFIGKCFIHHSFTSLYVYTSELWPTNLRHRVMGICSMIARIGSITAPLTPLLMKYMESLPFILFSGFAFTAGVLVLYLPETFYTSLPDSIEDAKNIQKKSNKSSNQI